MERDPNVISTTGQAAPFDFWHDVVCQRYTALSTERIGWQPFFGEIRAGRRIGDSSLSTIAAGAQIVRRTRSDIARRPSASFFVNIQLAGKCEVQVDDNDVLLGPGDSVALDADAPFSMRFDHPFRQACLHVDRSYLHPRDIRPMTVLRGAQALAAQIVAELGSLDYGHDAEDVIASVSSLLREGSNELERHSLAAQHLALIKAHIAEHSDTPRLSAEDVARRFRILKRHLHNLFARSGETFSQYLLRLRLRRAQVRIGSTHEIPLSRIAGDSGFKSASHFSRAFTQHYDINPRDWRKRFH